MKGTQHNLLSEIAARMGGANEVETRRALDATLLTLGEHLPPRDAAAVAAELPAALAPLLETPAHDECASVEEFYTRVAAREGLAVGFGHEHAQVVCRALAAALSAQARTQLACHLWPELLHPTLQDRQAAALPSRHGRDLASGIPGSRHPLSEAAPPTGVQRDSVAAADNPHEARKLSSGAPSAERGETTFAGGRAGSRHPLSEAKPRR
jgi:uncharacterized protein (DUF2267 family)